ncbi:hypothetical protein BGC07_08490 [Piscirickettsia litoralis]|uniref:Uncharacterized protein n=2 Tax=Piscirickettsia litoralis TaxID=1891921 RepID=A0ABX3A3Y1_9GAMM|nr:hypothetical protein BGC07_08490 [Piscirickettsia litoralis]
MFRGECYVAGYFFDFKSKLLGLFLKSKNEVNYQDESLNKEVSLLEQVNYFYDDTDDLYHYEPTQLHV